MSVQRTVVRASQIKQERLGKYYEQKRVEVIYVEEQESIVTVTVYVFYGEWKD